MSLPRVLRYRPGTDLLGFEKPPEGVTPLPVVLVAQDGPRSKGLLWARGGERTVVLMTHPRGDMTRHYLIPGYVEAGYAVFAHESRSPNNDANMTHEALLADIAAAVIFVRERGFEKVVFQGYSGGGAAYSFYQAQATTPPPGRLSDTAAGDPYDLNGFDMPPGDGFMFVGAHLGTGATMMEEIDPSVVDEHDPLSCDPALDMYDPANGFREPPEPSRYTPEFLDAYRAAQRARVARLDAIARSMLLAQREFRKLAEAEGFDALPLQARKPILRRASLGQFMQIHRTDANPAMVDLSLDPSLRNCGGINTLRPDLTNYSENGFARILTPKAWLSQWSGLSSRSSMLDNLPKVTVPTLVVGFTGDNAIHPHVAQATLEAVQASDKILHRVDADHFGFPLPSKPESGGRAAVSKIAVDWLKERFPAA